MRLTFAEELSQLEASLQNGHAPDGDDTPSPPMRGQRTTRR